MDLRDKLEEIANNNGWKFVYARRDYQNLFDVSQFISDELQDAGKGETVLFVDPISRRPDSPGIRYTGNLMLLTSYDFDGKYDQKYDQVIRPLIDVVTGNFYKDLICDFDIDDWTVIEVINMFDFNADGVSIKFNLKGY